MCPYSPGGHPLQLKCNNTAFIAKDCDHSNCWSNVLMEYSRWSDHSITLIEASPNFDNRFGIFDVALQIAEKVKHVALCILNNNVFFRICVFPVVCLGHRKTSRFYWATRCHPPRCHSVLWLQLSVPSRKRQFWKGLYFLAIVRGNRTKTTQLQVYICDNVYAYATVRQDFVYQSVLTAVDRHKLDTVTKIV